jgi:hypothetical protein
MGMVISESGLARFSSFFLSHTCDATATFGG